ncbi:MAG: ubiquinone/menaquinone biosynthesis methyltransferase [Phycisphaerae bacterium]
MLGGNSATDRPIWNKDDLLDPHAHGDKARRVRRMFDAIAPTYERVNTWSSAGRDRAWRRTAVKLAQVTAADQVIDVACGTGDFARAFVEGGAGAVAGIDFAEDMLRRAAARPTPRAAWCLGDALRLPFPDASFSVASCAFGVRNFQDLTAGLAEMRRVLRPHGRAVLLEFSLPSSAVMRRLYRLYLERIMPHWAGLISGDRNGAYHYLARSVVSFTDDSGMEQALRAARFASIHRHPLTLGIVTVWLAYACDDRS